MKQLRLGKRKERRELARVDQYLAAQALTRSLVKEPFFYRSKRIAFYLASDGEIDPASLLEAAAMMGKTCYLPRIQPSRRDRRDGSSRNLLWFFRYQPGDPLTLNRFGIPEPVPNMAARIRGTALDLVLLPLVAFDSDGNRLGMGKGYYDQTFAFARSTVAWHCPRLVGLAHACQEVDGLKGRPWDVPLDAVATDQHIHRFHARRMHL